MRVLSPTVLAALESRNVTIRDFVWIEPRDRTTGVVTPVGYWSDLGTVLAAVVNPRTDSTESRSFIGAGGLINISAIPLTSSLTVQPVTMNFSQVGNPNELVRNYDVKQARIEIFRGLFAPSTLVQLAPAYARFIGFVDVIEIDTPAEGGEGTIELTCVSDAQEMRRRNTATRSNADAVKRSSTDSFNRHTAAVGTWEMSWGKASSKSGGAPAGNLNPVVLSALNRFKDR